MEAELEESVEFEVFCVLQAVRINIADTIATASILFRTERFLFLLFDVSFMFFSFHNRC